MVRVSKWKTTGVVLDLISGNKVKVAMGTLQMILPVQDVELLLEKSLTGLGTYSGGGKRVKSTQISEVPTPASELDMRGLRLDDAMSELEHYIDQAFRCGAYREVSIIHGLRNRSITRRNS